MWNLTLTSTTHELYFQSIAYFLFSDWTAVEIDADIPWDLEGTPLQIKTDSILGSDEQIYVKMNGMDNKYIGYVYVKFSSQMQYRIAYCIYGWTDLPVEPPAEVDKIWTITKTETALIITCNEVEVLNFLFADISSMSICVSRWGGSVVEQIEFGNFDTASDFYKAAGMKFIGL